MESGEEMEMETERNLQLRYDAARLQRLHKLMQKDHEELLEAVRASQKTFEFLRQENEELKAQLKGLEWVAEEHQDLLEERRSELQALQETRDKVLALQNKNAEMEEKCERMDDELFHASCDLEDVQRVKERLRRETGELERSLVKTSLCWMRLEEREEDIAVKDAAISELKSIAENYAEYNRVSEQRVKELQERVSAACEWKGPSIAKEIAACEEAESEKLEEVEEKREGSTVKQSCVLSLAVKLLVLLFCLVLLVPSFSERTDTRGSELLLDAIKAALQPHCSIRFPRPPPV